MIPQTKGTSDSVSQGQFILSIYEDQNFYTLAFPFFGPKGWQSVLKNVF